MARRKSHRPPTSPASTAAAPVPRRAGHQVWLFGYHAVEAALANPARRCRRLLATAAAAEALSARLAARGGGARPAPRLCERTEIDHLFPPGTVHQGLALLAEPLESPDLSQVITGLGTAPEAVIVCLDQVTDPHNVGAVLRSAAAFGVAAVVVPRAHAPEVTGTLAKAASGALETVPLVRVPNLARALDEIKETGFWCAGLEPAAADTLAAARLGGRIALVLGSEGAGLRRLTRERCDVLVRIPLAPGVQSLNLAAAAAIALYELARRRIGQRP